MGAETLMRVMVRDGLFTDDDPPALLGTRCGACGRVHFPRADTCTSVPQNRSISGMNGSPSTMPRSSSEARISSRLRTRTLVPRRIDGTDSVDSRLGIL